MADKLNPGITEAAVRFVAKKGHVDTPNRVGFVPLGEVKRAEPESFHPLPFARAGTAAATLPRRPGQEPLTEGPHAPVSAIPEGAEKPDDKPGVKQTWLRGYLWANNFWPRMDAGLAIFTTAAVVSDPPESWVDLRNSAPSEGQITTLIDRRKAAHKIHEIDDDKLKISAKRMEELWPATVQKYVLPLVGSYIGSLSGPAVNVYDPTVIQAFFDDSRNAPYVERLQDILVTARDALTTRDSIGLSDFFKASTLDETNPLRYTYFAGLNTYGPRYKEEFGQDIAHYTNPGAGGWALASLNIRDAWTEKFTPHETRWLMADLNFPHRRGKQK